MMNEQEVRRALHETAVRQIGTDVNLWPGIRERLLPRQRRTWLPATRMGWAVAALAVFLALGTAAYGLASVIDRLFEQEVGLEQTQEANLGRVANLSQTADGVTARVERVYADAGRVVIGLTLHGANGTRYDLGQLTLTQADGTILWPVSGLGVAAESELLPGESAFVFTFDASPVQGAPESLDLRLSLTAVEALPPDSAQPTAPPPGMDAGVAAPASTAPTVGPFTFDLRVPFSGSPSSSGGGR
jgi:hypothetical protein